MTRFTSVRHLAFLLLMASCLLLPSSLVLAQEGNVPALRITKVNVDDYPNVKVLFDGRNLPAELAELPVTLRENGAEISTTSEMVDQGTQTALVLDASGSMLDQGLTGTIRKEEIQIVVRKLVSEGYLDQNDWLSVYAPNQEGEVETIHDWFQNHGEVYNQFYLYEYPGIDVVTPLFNLIYFGLDQFETSTVPSHLSRSIVLFSDGYGGGSNLELNDAVERATKANVVIHTVMLGEGTTETIGNMKRIATLTGGEYVQVTSDDALNVLWEKIVGKRAQRQLTYRSQDPNPNELLLSATLPNGEIIQGAKAFPSISVSEVEVSIINPSPGFEITKEAPAHDTPVQQLEPNKITVQADFRWPDDGQRTITQVEYIVNDDTKILKEEPFDQIEFSIEDLDDGNYTIRVLATDELGMKGEAEPLSFSVTVNRPPPPPAPTPEPATISIPIPGGDPVRIRQESARNIASMIALLLAVMAVIIAMRNPARRKQVTEAFGNVVKQVTQPFFPNRDDMKFKPSKATLIVINGDGKLPPSIDIRGANTKLGRSPDLANIVIDDTRVSRYHSRITEEPDGTFRIWDEGSTSGTYVNSVPVNLKAGQALKNEDLINLGPMQFKFRYVGVQDQKENTEGTRPYVGTPSIQSDVNGIPNQKDMTEPFIQ